MFQHSARLPARQQSPCGMLPCQSVTAVNLFYGTEHHSNNQSQCFLATSHEIRVITRQQAPHGAPSQIASTAGLRLTVDIQGQQTLDLISRNVLSTNNQHLGFVGNRFFTFQYAKARVQQVNAHHCLRNNTVKQGLHAGLSLRETTETRCQKCSLGQSHWQRTLLHGDWNDTELEQFNASVNNVAR